MPIRTEMETVVKRILPYLERRGYVVHTDLDFETAVQTDRYSRGYVDILVTLGKQTASFLIEAKRISKKLTNKDRDQAVDYAKCIGVPFVVVTNGTDIRCYNTKNKECILWDGKSSEKIPSREQLKLVLRSLKTNPDETNIKISNDKSLPYRPSVPLRRLNAIFYKGHNDIRKIEKNEEHAFADFTKLLFLKLLEEKSDAENDFVLPYSYKFHELAKCPANKVDQVRDAITSMLKAIREKAPYGDVLKEDFKLKHPKTFFSLVKSLSSISFYDCSVDSKGAAFEYYVRATLKGKKLGQYFTPRELIKIMAALVGQNKIVNSVLLGTPIKVLDPACGTGGFLVYLMQDAIQKIHEKNTKREISKADSATAVERIRKKVFFGSDANEGVAASAKMNMIIAGDGHANIRHEDSLAKAAKNWSKDKPDCTLILTNPPFGTSEADSLTGEDKEQFDVSTTKGQYLFLQKMVGCTVPGGEICTVIDEGVLNTESGAMLRKYILKTCRVKSVISLPPETFKPNKINVRASVLFLEKRDTNDDFEDQYKITIVNLSSLGYHGSGDKIRGFKFDNLINDIENCLLDQSKESYRRGDHWEAFDIDSQDLYDDQTHRLDFKYWITVVREKIKILVDSGQPTIENINTIKTMRGKSPSADSYVDENDGYAIVIKAGNIDRLGKLQTENADWIEKSVFDEYAESAHTQNREALTIRKHDVLLASTGEGTLGKCCVFDLETPAIPDGHVTVIRVDTKRVCPYYLADFLRLGFGQEQINRLFTGSTGLIELTSEQVDSIVVDLKNNLSEQKAVSKKIRSLEDAYLKKLTEADAILLETKSFLQTARK